MNPKKREIFKRFTDDLIATGCAEPVRSAWAANLTMAPKKDGTCEHV